ncbi:MAG: hypothetical protein Q7K54_02775 [Candidatus Parcubacteria bacterium]|nr:hypothetical protein [Candidatus Parcubacteria bacterium]
MTFDQRMNLAIKLWTFFTAFMVLALILGWVAAAMEEKLMPLILLLLCVIIGIIFASVSMWVRYHEAKPGWQQELDRKWKQEADKRRKQRLGK